VQASGHELLLEIIPPSGLPRAADTVVRAIQRLYNLEIFPEWWKLEPMAAAEWAGVDALIEARDPYCRGVLLLGQAANAATLAAGFAEARESRTCRGFAVGRTIFHEPSRKWLAGHIDDAALVRAVRGNFEALIRAWHVARGESPAAAKTMKETAA
jgi:5-dehydro-2-deoxygluconokinase